MYPYPSQDNLATVPETMWWTCDVRFCRNTLRLKLWARSENDARAKVERMYQVATIECLAMAGDSGFLPFAANSPFAEKESAAAASFRG